MRHGTFEDAVDGVAETHRVSFRNRIRERIEPRRSVRESCGADDLECEVSTKARGAETMSSPEEQS